MAVVHLSGTDLRMAQESLERLYVPPNSSRNLRALPRDPELWEELLETRFLPSSSRRWKSNQRTNSSSDWAGAPIDSTQSLTMWSTRHTSGTGDLVAF